MGAQTGLVGSLVTLAEAHAKLGQLEEALARIAEASDLLEKTGERQAGARLHVVKGDLLLALLRDAEAESCFQRAIDP